MRTHGLILLAAAAACGGTAVVDGVNGGGGTTTTTTTGTGTGTGPAMLCSAACDSIASCLSDPSGCEQRCNDVTPACVTMHEEFLACHLDTTAGGNACSISLECSNLLGQWLTCESPMGLGVGSCFADSDGNCGCSLDVSVGPNDAITMDTLCSKAGNGAVCECLVNGVEVGECNQTSGGSTCDPLEGCCAPLLFIPF